MPNLVTCLALRIISVFMSQKIIGLDGLERGNVRRKAG